MASGFFLGGAAEGMADAEKQRLARETLATESGLRTRGLDIQERTANSNISLGERAQSLSEKNAEREAVRQGVATVDKHIADTMAVVGETVKSALAAGRDPAVVQKAITPLVESAKRLAAAAGKDTAALDAQVGALLANPTGAETASAVAQGKAEGEVRGKIAGAKAQAEAGLPPDVNKEKVSAENTLRDDYTKASANFYTMRDAKDRLDNLEKSGAGDMALVFQFMKMLDPTSTVREGEYASAANSGGVPSSVQALYNKALGEGSIGDKAREGIRSQANRFYQAGAARHDKIQTDYANIAKRQGLTIENVVVDPRNSNTVTGKTPGGIGFRASR